MQLSTTRGMLAVADNRSDKLVLYEVDAANNSIRPVKASRLDEIFARADK
jgi:hypothetical protein